MERFAFKIDDALRANLYKICRLCGIDNKTKIPIIENEEGENSVDIDAEPTLSQKILNLIGVSISKKDKMPQTMCSLCVDKINDFYEFREMCYATNTQTRKLLGLKPLEPKNMLKIDVKPLVSVKDEPSSTLAKANRGRKRRSDALVNNVEAEVKTELEQSINPRKESAPLRKKKRFHEAKLVKRQQQPVKPKPEIKDEPIDEAVETVKSVKKNSKGCSICSERFENKILLEQHKSTAHLPNIPRYFCNACDQIHNNNNDIKSHQLWHKLSKTPFKCGLCEESIPTNYAFVRHIRDHTEVLPVELQVFDRVCPQCKSIYVTNFLYNTHPCAIKTRRCGGCSKYLRSEGEYIRHAALCPKAFLNHSKHIPGEVPESESQVRIKNENEVEEEIGRNIDLSMQPYVSLTRMSSPMIRAAISSPVNNDFSTKKSGKKASTKNYLKRVDKLLKSTIDTLVSIKHEPEVQVEADETESDRSAEYDNTDFQDNTSEHAESDTEKNCGTNTDCPDESLNPSKETLEVVKKELVDDSYGEHSKSKVDRTADVQIKEEPKPFALKLKITKEHGQLNSSLVDDEETTPTGKKKKKKKRKEAEKQRSKEVESSTAKENSAATAVDNEPTSEIQIKQELLDDSYGNANKIPETQESQVEAPVMTSIPMTQLEGTCLSSEQADSTKETQGQNIEAEPVDIKPNRLELDQMLQITHVASGIQMAEEVAPEIEPVEVTNKRATARKSTGAFPQTSTDSFENDTTIPVVHKKLERNKPTARITARKSTSAAQILTQKINISEPVTLQAFNESDEVQSSEQASLAETSSETALVDIVPQIVAVQCGPEVEFDKRSDVVIKQEPTDRGYSDETCADQFYSNNEVPQEESAEAEDEDETSFITKVDYSNITIKQEKDLDLLDMQLDENQLLIDASHNGLQDSSRSNEHKDSSDTDETMSSAEDEEEEVYEQDSQSIVGIPIGANTFMLPNSNEQNTLGLVITNICGQTQILEDMPNVLTGNDQLISENQSVIDLPTNNQDTDEQMPLDKTFNKFNQNAASEIQSQNTVTLTGEIISQEESKETIENRLCLDMDTNKPCHQENRELVVELFLDTKSASTTCEIEKLENATEAENMMHTKDGPSTTANTYENMLATEAKLTSSTVDEDYYKKMETETNRIPIGETANDLLVSSISTTMQTKSDFNSEDSSIETQSKETPNQICHMELGEIDVNLETEIVHTENSMKFENTLNVPIFTNCETPDGHIDVQPALSNLYENEVTCNTLEESHAESREFVDGQMDTETTTYCISENKTDETLVSHGDITEGQMDIESKTQLLLNNLDAPTCSNIDNTFIVETTSHLETVNTLNVSDIKNLDSNICNVADENILSNSVHHTNNSTICIKSSNETNDCISMIGEEKSVVNTQSILHTVDPSNRNFESEELDEELHTKLTFNTIDAQNYSTNENTQSVAPNAIQNTVDRQMTAESLLQTVNAQSCSGMENPMGVFSETDCGLVPVHINTELESQTELHGISVPTARNVDNLLLAATDTIVGHVIEEPIDELKAQPVLNISNISANGSFFEDGVNSTDSEEEQQNVLNHEISVHNVEAAEISNDPCCSGIQINSGNTESCLKNEETENQINEQQQQILQQQQQLLHINQPQDADDSNINEIAENNNNANIERELQDENNILDDITQDNAAGT